MPTEVLIPGATASARTLTPGDVGKILFCRVRGTNTFGFGLADSNQRGPITGSGVTAPPSILTLPDIADLTPEVSEILHTTDGIWAGVPAPTFSYQWHRVTVDAPEAPSNTEAPNIADTTPTVSEVLHTTDGVWDGSPAPTFSYQWHRVTSDVPAAPSNTGAPNIADTDPTVSEILHVTDGTWSGFPAPTFNYEWHRVTEDEVPEAPSNTGAPAIADVTPTVAETLHVSNGTWDGVPAPTFGYQWFKVGEAATITSSASTSNTENTVLTHALTANQTVTWTLISGSDQARFELSGSTLRWDGNGTKNFEAPNDSDLNNAYVVVVRATNTTGHVTDQTITVTVTDVPESTLTFDFQANTSTIAGAASTAVAPLTVARTGTAAWAEKLDGTWQNFAANTARRTDKGLLIEEAKNNIVLQNRTQSNASWVKTTCTATKNQIGVDGAANSCCSLTATAANATCLNTTSTTSSARYQSAFIKRLVGTGNIQMTMDNGATWTTIVITSSWARYSIPTQTLANPVVGFRIVTSGDSIAVDLVQNEAGSFVTSPITTTTAAVTRPGDAITINVGVAPIASWFNQPAGTLFAEGIGHNGPMATPNVFQIDAGNVNNSHRVGLPGGAPETCGNTTTASTAQGSFTGTNISGVNKAAWAYAVNDLAGSCNGAAVVTDTSATMPTGLTTTRIGTNGTLFWSGYLRKITYYPTRISNSALVTLTAP